MRKIQNIISTFGTIIARQGKQLVVRIESLRSLCARFLSALSSYASELALGLRNDAWQGLLTGGLCMTWWLPNVVVPVVVVKQSCRRHLMRHRIIGRHRTAA